MLFFSGVMRSAISSVICTSCSAQSCTARSNCLLMDSKCTALSCCSCCMKNSAHLAKMVGSLSAFSSSEIFRSASKSRAEKQSSKALFCCPLFWYKITAFEGCPFCS
eukprot:Skav217451  [mRNA]  locus=scaffold518:195347:204467:+ [translate_table: standard]